MRGFAAVLLGECLLFCGEDVQVGTVEGGELAVFAQAPQTALLNPPLSPLSPQAKAVAHDAILGRAGLAKFLAVADGLRTHPAVVGRVPGEAQSTLLCVARLPFCAAPRSHPPLCSADDRPASTPVLDADMRAFLADFEGRFQSHITAGPAAAPSQPAAAPESEGLAQAQATIAALQE